MIRKYISWLLPLLLVGGYFLGRYIYFQPKYGTGEMAPDIEARLLNQKPFKLSALNGQYVLLDFWGSWCGPCRRQNPALVKVYEEYRLADFPDGDGFTVVGIGVDQNRANLERAIARDGLSWPYHIQDETTSYRFFNAPIANLYGVKQLPTNFLIGPAGDIIAENLEPEALDDFLAQRLGLR